jgi:hypothetical protein
MTLCALLVVGGLLHGPRVTRAATEWLPVASMNVARSYHSLTPLRDGRVLAAGGTQAAATQTAEVYDPATNSWTMTGPLIAEHASHTATLLDDGTVLVVGDFASSGIAERFDPEANIWFPAGTLTHGRFNHSATLLEDGTVLVYGGGGPTTLRSSFERYDPITNTWTLIDNTVDARTGHSATLLIDGTLLIAGGANSAGDPLGARIWNPALESWGNPIPDFVSRAGATTVTLADGQVLIAGGAIGSPHVVTGVTQIYNPFTGAFTTVGSLNIPRYQASGTLLRDGSVLIVGGWGDPSPAMGSSEIFLLQHGGWMDTGSLANGRYHHPAVLLPNGSVFVAGGEVLANGGTTSVERFPPNAPPAVSPPLQNLRLGAIAKNAVPVTISWSYPADPDGILQNNLQRKTNSGSFVPVQLPNHSSVITTLSLTPGSTNTFRVRSTDLRYARSPWATGTPQTLRVRDDGALGMITYTGAWTTAASSAAYGGGVRHASAAGRRATFTFTGTNVGWVTTKGPGRGKAEIWLDGTRVRTIDLYAPTFRARQMVFTWNNLSSGTHTLEIRVLGARNPDSSSNRVDIDGFVLLQ